MRPLHSPPINGGVPLPPPVYMEGNWLYGGVPLPPPFPSRIYGGELIIWRGMEGFPSPSRIYGGEWRGSPPPSIPLPWINSLISSKSIPYSRGSKSVKTNMSIRLKISKTITLMRCIHGGVRSTYPGWSEFHADYCHEANRWWISQD